MRCARRFGTSAAVGSARARDFLRGRWISGVGRDRGPLGVTVRGKLAAEANAAKTYLPGGRAPRSGEIFRNSDLAQAIRRIAKHGPSGFYEGETADAILSISREHGGTMTHDDLRAFAPEWVTPISTTYRGWTVYELPPNTQGIAALMMLDLMEYVPPRPLWILQHAVASCPDRGEEARLRGHDPLRRRHEVRCHPGGDDAEQGACASHAPGR